MSLHTDISKSECALKLPGKRSVITSWNYFFHLRPQTTFLTEEENIYGHNIHTLFTVLLSNLHFMNACSQELRYNTNSNELNFIGLLVMWKSKRTNITIILWLSMTLGRGWQSRECRRQPSALQLMLQFRE